MSHCWDFQCLERMRGYGLRISYRNSQTEIAMQTARRLERIGLATIRDRQAHLTKEGLRRVRAGAG